MRIKTLLGKTANLTFRFVTTNKNDSFGAEKLKYEDEFLNMGRDDYWILNSRTIKYININKEEETQKFVFEDLCLLN